MQFVLRRLFVNCKLSSDMFKCFFEGLWAAVNFVVPNGRCPGRGLGIWVLDRGRDGGDRSEQTRNHE